MITALAQMDVAWEDYAANIKKIKNFVKEAVSNKAELILFPEMCLSGFTNNIDALIDEEDELIKLLKGIALLNKINIGVGYGIKGHHHKGENRYIIISKNGDVLCKYTKIHPFTMSGEDEFFNAGTEINMCSIGEFNITPFICYDLRFPEIFQIASKKSNIITVAASWPKARENHWLALLKARAIENQCFVLGINRTGEGDNLIYNGGSVFVAPDGEFLNVPSNEEMLIIHDIKMSSIEKIKEQFDIKKDRREELYYNIRL